MKYLLLYILSFVGFLLSNSVEANTEDNNSFTLYLIRHAEKQVELKNPPLTECGLKRAEQIAITLEQTNIEKIYSTQYTRTEQTVAPIAKKLSLDVISYSPSALKEFSQQIMNDQTTALIVGHSNTTPQLAALLSGMPVSDITEQEYQMLYQVSFINGKAQLNIFKQPLVCP